MNRHYLFLATSIFAGMTLVTVASCDRRPKAVLSEDEMVSLMTDMQLAEAYTDVSGKGGDYTAMRKSLSEGVLSAHGVSQAQLDSTLLWYGKNVDEYNELFKKVDKEIDKRKRRFLADSRMSQEEIAEGNLWPYSPHMTISGLGDTDNIRFSIPTTEEIKKGDVFTWKMHFHSPRELKGMIGVDYSDGSTSVMTRSLSGNPDIEMRLQTDSSRTPVRLFGVLRVRQQSSLPIYADSIMLLRSPLDSSKYYNFHSQTFVRPPQPKKKTTELKENDSIKSLSHNLDRLNDRL